MLETIIQERVKKRNILEKTGYNPYPGKAINKERIEKIIKNFFLLSLFRKKVSIAGRIVGLRNQGGVFFIDIKDATGNIQGVANKKTLDDFTLFRDNLDIGDFIFIKGNLFKTKKGEKSVNIEKITVLTKSLMPLPSEWYGLKDIEERFRKRYLDIILNEEIKNKLLLRSKIIICLRKILSEDGFLEVETPMLQPIPGGALAKPFKTHHNALDVDFYLRIAPELYLKRLLVGGIEKVFEMGKNFRNEGIDKDHNPEFTMLELYWAYQDCNGLMNAAQNWLTRLLNELGIKEKTIHNNEKVNFCEKWGIITYEEAIKKYSGKNIKDLKTEEMDELFKKTVRSKFIQPTFVIRYPKEISPLAKSCEDDPYFTERFQLVVAGTELINGWTELNDPADQRERMEKQEKMYRSGNEEVTRKDEDFIEALEYGMPPAAGFGIGIDRLVALLTNSRTIKEVIIFPTLRPK